MIKNFIVNSSALPGGVTDRDIVVVLHPESFDEVECIEAEDLAMLAVAAGIFASRSQARKNGLAGPIPHGLHLFGTKKKRFWVWSPAPPARPPVFHENFDYTMRWMERNFELDTERGRVR